jgi:Protein of unknown function (DUF2442)
MYYAVISVEPLQDFMLRLTFKNGERKIFDMKPLLNTGIFKELKNVEIFNTAKVSFDTVEWANDADIDPETLYAESLTVN